MSPNAKRKTRDIATDITTDTHLAVAAALEARVACPEARVATAEAENKKWRGYAEAWVRPRSQYARDALLTRVAREMSWAGDTATRHRRGRGHPWSSRPPRRGARSQERQRVF